MKVRFETSIKTIYIADDGKEFYREVDCQRHELINECRNTHGTVFILHQYHQRQGEAYSSREAAEAAIPAKYSPNGFYIYESVINLRPFLASKEVL